MIRWIQEKQNLWQFYPATEWRIITYLAWNYGLDATQRRAALLADQTLPDTYRTAPD